MTLNRHVTVAVVSLFLTGALPAQAQPSGSNTHAEAPARLTPAERDTALAAITEAVQKSYVFPEKRAAVLERLSQSRKEGRYDVDSPSLLAARITDDLKSSSGDLHLYLQHAPARYAAAKAPKGQGADADAYGRNQALREHHGLTETRVLAGNVRYLKISSFRWTRDETGVAYDDAMRFLKDGDALILDLRGNGGGSHAAVQYLVSHFLEEGTLLMTFHRGSEPPVQSRALEHVPAGRMKGKPLYVLIDGGVGSAGEDFVYDVQQFKLGELIGARTSGAANNNWFTPIPPAFMLSVPEGRPVHAVSQTNWDGVGIAPDVDVPPVQALEVAHSRALKGLMAAPTPTPAQRAEYTWAQVGIEARLHPVSIAPARLKSLAGRFGEMQATFRDGALWLVRDRRPDARLTPLTQDGLFAVEGSERLRVRLTGKALELSRLGEPAPVVLARS
ncbi:S41 family peptidase [Corallococcus sp. bb12-1]|uniref:S41 family peptidase n=1 Tax=Corallococcus sp. bb12-1 TaxID=2996784 RepID=UPI0022710D45|nr:S41 family peptidase [Corallococcus sp. bb12-1]MCY1039714.1 S41 family peptidase [Corallococcus sp. bb12-1]